MENVHDKSAEGLKIFLGKVHINYFILDNTDFCLSIRLVYFSNESTNPEIFFQDYYNCSKYKVVYKIKCRVQLNNRNETSELYICSLLKLSSALSCDRLYIQVPNQEAYDPRFDSMMCLA